MTFLEQRESYDALEPAWSGAMERNGSAAGLSGYQGHSTLYAPEPTRESESENPNLIVRRHTAPKHAYRSLDSAILTLLEEGLGYRAIGRKLGCSMTGPRRVAQAHGLGRWRPRDTSRDGEIVPMLKKGVSLRQIALALGVTESVPRRVAKMHGIILKGRMKGAKA